MYKKIIYFILSVVLLLGAGCKKPDVVGDQLIFVTSNPLVANTGLTVNNINPDFTASNKTTGTPVSFAASFTTEASWKIVIQGKLSNAVKEISGTGKIIDHTNSIWEGDATSIQFFMSQKDHVNDTCTASLYVQGLAAPIASTKLVIKNLISYNWRTLNGVRYLLIEDFDGNHMGLSGPAGGMLGLSYDAGDNNTAAFYTTQSQRINGANGYHMEGTDVNNNGWLFSLNHKNLVEMVNPNSSLNIDSSTSPQDLYINLYIRGTGQPNSSIEVKMYEYDAARNVKQFADTVSLVAPAFEYTVPMQAQNDGWIYDIIIDWEGWKLVSIPYYKFRVANDLTTGGAGNHIKEPWKITAAAISLLSYPAYGYSVSADVDFFILSEGGPFVPKYSN